MTISAGQPILDGDVSDHRFKTLWVIAAIVSFGVAGCRSREIRFHVTNYDAAGDREVFYEAFDECYYTIDPSGNLDLVARRHTRTDDPDVGEITQIVLLRTVYRNVPGAMASDRTMINSVVTYAILGPDGGACYEGAGFVYFREKPRREKLIGELELSTVRPHRRVGKPTIIFDRAELTGSFEATEDRRKVVHIINELRRVFGEMPRHQPRGQRDVL